MKTGYIYIRSNGAKENNELYLYSNLQQLMGFANKHNISIRQVFIDTPSFGKYEERQYLTQLMKQLKKDREAYLIISEPKDLFRGITDFAEWKKTHSIKVVCLSENRDTRPHNLVLLGKSGYWKSLFSLYKLPKKWL